jgi:hypothetical protein
MLQINQALKNDIYYAGGSLVPGRRFRAWYVDIISHSWLEVRESAACAGSLESVDLRDSVRPQLHGKLADLSIHEQWDVLPPAFRVKWPELLQLAVRSGAACAPAWPARATLASPAPTRLFVLHRFGSLGRMTRVFRFLLAIAAGVNCPVLLFQRASMRLGGAGATTVTSEASNSSKVSALVWGNLQGTY